MQLYTFCLFKVAVKQDREGKVRERGVACEAGLEKKRDRKFIPVISRVKKIVSRKLKYLTIVFGHAEVGIFV